MKLQTTYICNALESGRIIRSSACDEFATTGLISYRFMHNGRGWAIARDASDNTHKPYEWQLTFAELIAEDWRIISETVNRDIVDAVYEWRRAIRE